MNWILILSGLCLHLIFFYSIFDIYFTSPLIHGMTPHASTLEPPAKRLILFVADGLRADKLFEADKLGKYPAPFLRSKVLQSGAWGVAHTRVPTESRPGHVALIAGFYEDVSAVAKGWKENPVQFDSVFNESRYTWSWGSPDILPMFARGAHSNHVSMEMYPAESEDFAGADAKQLDTWVFTKVKKFLQVASENETLAAMLSKDKLILFLHLLGIDTNGHAHRPFSSQYLHNIEVVDLGIQEITAAIEEYFHNDGKTSYILTADHGMTDWGSHGAGSPSETQTPLIAWGAGIRGPQQPLQSEIFSHNFQKMWNLNNVRRSDVNQVDIAPLMSAILGIPFPLNSVGVLPLDYLHATKHFKAETFYENSKQIFAQFELKMKEKIKTTLSLLFKPFPELTLKQKESICNEIDNNLKEENYAKAIENSRMLIEKALAGLSYYHKYDRLLLGFCITMSFLGWMFYVATLLIQHTKIAHSQPFSVNEDDISFWSTETPFQIFFSIAAAIVVFLLYVQSLPWTYYIYCLLPIILWQKIALNWSLVISTKNYIMDTSIFVKCIVTLLAGIAGLEILVQSFFYRELLSVGLLGMAIWPLCTGLWHDHKALITGWTVSCILLAIFPLLPVVGHDSNVTQVVVSGCLAFLLGCFAVIRYRSEQIGNLR